ncbi:MAG TPA: sodium:proton antiporter [Spirochaetota bacterium]|nr:sodium:proton antiporter [Spirochaetota bacterium]HPS86604.1 sodium:proton antiporter [Spirochaetota bacterium]
MILKKLFTAFLFVLTPVLLSASQAEHVVPTELSILWVLPFVGILLCIAIIPLINGHFWEKNLWWISLGVFCIPMSLIFTIFMGEQLRELTFEKALEYISFIILLGSLFTISGGILIKGSLNGTPVVNSIFLFIGSIIASFVGTTGASMLLIRPLIRANSSRKNKAHIVIFFIFLVSNIGGLLTPLGDPPLFLGYLQGVPFTWTLRLLPQWAVASSIVLAIFYFFDVFMYRKETGTVSISQGSSPAADQRGFFSIENDITNSLEILDLNRLADKGRITLQSLATVRRYLNNAKETLLELSTVRTDNRSEKFGIDGKLNLVLLAGIVICIFMQGVMVKKFPGKWPAFGPQELGMLILTGISLLITPLASETRKLNGFTFGPIKEVAFLFAGIFAAMIPALHILQHKGAALGIVKPWQFFWASGSLSSFLDNAPTYLTFLSVGKGLNLPNDLGFVLNDGTGLSAAVLAAISCGSVFMGANTYIGNGPNFMVRSIAEENGVKMPSFFGYMLYSGSILIPTFILITFIFFI